MTDTDKANALDWLNEIITNPYGWRMFYSASETKSCAEATLALLKEQEPVKPKREVCGRHWDLDVWTYVCGNCGNAVDIKDAYCRHCGRKVLWDETPV